MKFCYHYPSMKKLLLILLLFFCAIKPAQSATQFTTSYDVTYDIQESGSANVTKKITIKNNTAEYYAADFTLLIPDSGITNIKATRNNKELAIKTEKKENAVEVYLQFNDQVVGIGKSINFEVSYQSRDVAKLKGSNLQIIIPGISKDYQGNYQVQVHVPKTRVGSTARIQPKPAKESENDTEHTYTYSKNQLAESSVIMNFGDSQTYDMSLIYYLENTSKTARARAEVALPPNTEYQQIVYESLEPKPKSMKIDTDGNYIAEYIIEPGKSIEVQAKTQAIISAQPIQAMPALSDEIKGEYLKQQEYWDVDSTEIQELAETYRDPKSIYNFVVQKLSYAKDRRDTASLRRQGSLETLKNPDKAVCMEFTDLFIAISRAAGIPAREVNGYGFTDDERETETLYADNFHAWPEYYDEKQQRWIQVDPTWQDTTGGFDYFTSFDTNHIAFVRRGISSTFPVGAGAYRRSIEDKTAFVSYRNTEPQIKNEIKAEVSEEVRLAGFADEAVVKVTNTGNIGYIGTLQSVISPKGIISDTTMPVHIPPFAEIELMLPFQIPWHEEKDLQLTVTDNNNQTLVKSIVEINPLYTHPYTLLAAAYITAILIILIVFNRFIRHH